MTSPDTVNVDNHAAIWRGAKTPSPLRTPLHFTLVIISSTHPHKVDALCIDGRASSVCLSVCPVAEPESRTEGYRKLKIGMKEAYDTGGP